MPNYAIMRIEKAHIEAVTPICNHHERLKEEYKSNPDIDKERSHLNFHIIKPAGKYRQLVLKRIEEAGARRRKNSVVLQDGLVAATPDWIKSKSTEEQGEYFTHAFEFFKDKFRLENIISAVVHLDEATPHMHICWVPITEDNRLSSKDMIGGPKGMHMLQDEFYEHMEKKYPDLSRGIDKAVTQREHIPTYLIKSGEQLMDHYSEIVEAVNKIGMLNNSQNKEKAIEMLSHYAPELAQVKNQLSTTDDYIRELKAKLESKDAVIHSKDKELNGKDKEIYQLRTEIHKLNRDLSKLQKMVDKIPPEVMEKMIAEENERRKHEDRDSR